MGSTPHNISATDPLDHPADQFQGQAGMMLGKIFAAAEPGAVFGAPVVAGAHTIITASEVSAGGGFGSGFRSGRGTRPQPLVRGTETPDASGEGGGAGGGGGASGRPIAAIVIGPDGVTVRPIFDFTKIALAGITAWGAMLAIFLRLRAKGR